MTTNDMPDVIWAGISTVHHPYWFNQEVKELGLTRYTSDQAIEQRAKVATDKIDTLMIIRNAHNQDVMPHEIEGIIIAILKGESK